MSRITMDANLESKLNGLSEQVEVCDESGKTIGRFLPEALFREFLVLWSKAHLPDDELEGRRKEPRGRTLAEIWQRLGQPDQA